MRRLFALLVFFLPLILHGQKSYSLQIIETGQEDVLKNITWTKTFPTASAREKELHNVLIALWNKSYLAARYDSILIDSLSLVAYLDPGTKHTWARIRKGNVDEGILSEIGFREKVYRNRPMRYREVARL